MWKTCLNSVKSELQDRQFQDAIAQTELWKEEIPTRYVYHQLNVR